MNNDKILAVKDSVLKIATKYVGIKETPKNSNRGPEIDQIQKWYGMVGQQYCMASALYWWKLALEENGITNFPWRKTPSTQEFLSWTRKNGFFKNDIKSVSHGDIVLWTKFTRPSISKKWTGTWQGHAELVISSCASDGTFKTIGGNTSPDTSSNERDGGGIHYKIRNAKRFEVFPEKGTYALVLRGVFDCETALAKL